MQNKGTLNNTLSILTYRILNSTPYNNDLISNVTFMFRMQSTATNAANLKTRCYKVASTSKDRQVSDPVI